MTIPQCEETLNFLSGFSFRSSILKFFKWKKTPKTKYKILPCKEIEDDEAIEQADVSRAAVSLD